MESLIKNDTDNDDFVKKVKKAISKLRKGKSQKLIPSMYGNLYNRSYQKG